MQLMFGLNEVVGVDGDGWWWIVVAYMCVCCVCVMCGYCVCV